MVKLSTSCLVLSLLALFPSSVESQETRGLAAYRPQQGIVVDGEQSAERTLLLSFSRSGFLVRHVQPAFLCPGDTPDPAPDAFVLAEEPVFRLERQLIIYDHVRAVRPFGVPPELAALSDDCQLLENFALVQDFLADADSRRGVLLTQVQDCLDELRDVYCDALSDIDDAPLITKDSDDGVPIPIFNYNGGSSSGAAPAPCTQFRQLLTRIPPLLDAMTTARSLCSAALGVMRDVADTVVALTVQFGGLTEYEKDVLRTDADNLLGLGDEALADAQGKGAEIDALIAMVTLEAVEASCDACSDPGASQAREVLGTNEGLGSGDEQRQAVVVRYDNKPLRRYVTRLVRAAHKSDDRTEAWRLRWLAARLAWLPRERVLHAIYRTESPIAEEFVALRSHEGCDDGSSPLAVVMTALATDAPLPDRTPADDGRLFDAMRLFNETVRAASPDR